MRMRIIFKLFIAAFILLSQNALAVEKDAFRPVSDLFLAISEFDHEKMKIPVTDDFLLLEQGEIWKIDDLLNAVKPSTYKRTNYFSIIDAKYHGDLGWISYWNKANFDNGKKSEDVVWLESVIVIKQLGVWKLAQMHSTKLEPVNVPKNIPFVKQ
jgi:hypothetical protein